MAKVSVIVPIYKVEKFLEQCIQSIQNQTEREIEIILVDDGSPDGSPVICDRYAAQDARIRVIHQKNAGVSAARNAGMAAAAAEWIMFVDGDDWLEENAVEVLYRNAIQTRSEIVIGSYYQVYEHETKICDRMLPRDTVLTVEEHRQYLLGSVLIESHPASLPEELRTLPLLGYPWGKLYKAAFLKEHRLQFVPGLKRMQDTVFNLYAIQFAETISLLKIPVYHYRIWTGSVCRRMLPDQTKVYASVLYHMNEFMQNCGTTQLLRPYLDLLAVNMAFEYGSLLGNQIQALPAVLKQNDEIRRFVEACGIRTAAVRADASIQKSKKQEMKLFLLRHGMYKMLLLLTYVNNKFRTK